MLDSLESVAIGSHQAGGCNYEPLPLPQPIAVHTNMHRVLGEQWLLHARPLRVRAQPRGVARLTSRLLSSRHGLSVQGGATDREFRTNVQLLLLQGMEASGVRS